MQQPAARDEQCAPPTRNTRQLVAINDRAEVLRTAQSADFLGVGLTKLWLIRRNDPTFPKPVRLGARAIGFRRTELLAWVESKQAR